MHAKDNPALILAIAGGAVCLIAVFLLGVGSVLFYQSWSIQRGWTSAEARVLHSRVVPVKKHLGETGTLQYKTEFDVRYQAGAHVFLGTIEAPYHSDDQEQMKAWAEQYPDGAALAVKFNPKNPAKVVFGGDVSYLGGITLLGFGMVAVLLSGGLLYGARRKRHGLSLWPRTMSAPVQP